jgi:hypothetical protein
VNKLVAKVKGWWRSGPSGRRLPAPYRVACACGQVLAGTRQPVHQVVACPRCGGKVFVLPQSPWPSVSLPRARTTAKAAGATPAAPALWKWAVPLTLLTAAAGGLVLWLWHLLPPAPPESAPRPVNVRQRLKAAREALAQANFRTAAAEAAAALAPGGRFDGTLDQRRALTRLRREAALLADLADVPLEDMIRHAREVSPEEWQLVFPRRYLDRAVLFDAEVTRNAAGRYEMDYPLRVGNQAGRVAVGDLDLVRQLGKLAHLDQPTRLLVGARVAGIAQDAAGTWVVFLRPDSGLLFAERAAVVAACPGLADDPDLDALLTRQAGWLAELP